MIGSKRSQYARSRPGEKECVTPSDKHRGANITMLECSGNNKVGDFVRVRGVLVKTQYHRILLCHTVPYRKRLIRYGFVLQQNKSTSQLCRKAILIGIKSQENDYL